MLFWLPTPFLNVHHRYVFYKDAERMRMDLERVALAFLHVIEIVWSSSGGWDDSFWYNYVAGNVKAYLTGSNALRKRQKADHVL